MHTLTQKHTDFIYRINANDNIQKYLVQIYYYKANELVCAKVRLEDWQRGGRASYIRIE